MKPHEPRTPGLFGPRNAPRSIPPGAPRAFVTALLLLGGALLALGGCQDRSAGDSAERADPAAPAAQAGRAGLPGTDAARTAGLPDEIAASHILVAWTGVRDCPQDLVRTREEAEERARRIALLLRTGRRDLGDLARRYSDDPTAPRNGGYLGVFRRDEMHAALEELVLSLAEGEIGGPVMTAYGWHVVRREPVPKVRLHHLLIAFRGAREADQRVARGQAEARRIATILQARLGQPGADPCALAATFSDDPENRGICGDLGWIVPGFLEPEIERAIFALGPGAVSPVVETEYGYHIFWRP